MLFLHYVYMDKLMKEQKRKNQTNDRMSYSAEGAYGKARYLAQMENKA
jgi:hypothetical protein